MSDSIFQEIDELTELDRGWYYGEGDPVSEKAAVLAKQFHHEISHNGKSDVFPGLQGSVILQYFNFPKAIEVEVHPDGTYRVSREVGVGMDFEIDFYENNIAREKAKRIVEQNDSEVH